MQCVWSELLMSSSNAIEATHKTGLDPCGSSTFLTYSRLSMGLWTNPKCDMGPNTKKGWTPCGGSTCWAYSELRMGPWTSANAIGATNIWAHSDLNARLFTNRRFAVGAIYKTGLDTLRQQHSLGVFCSQYKVTDWPQIGATQTGLDRHPAAATLLGLFLDLL
jgi:hypothetical protein